MGRIAGNEAEDFVEILHLVLTQLPPALKDARLVSKKRRDPDASYQ